MIQEFQALVHGFVECLQTMSSDRILTSINNIYLVNKLLFLIEGLIFAKLLNEVVAIFVGHENSYVSQYLGLHNDHDLRIPMLFKDILH